MINLNSRDFSGTNIKSSADKMRAMTIITAKDDTDGLNKLNFSLTFLLQSSAHQDICYVMGQWATEPVRRNPGKYIRFPAAGKEALINRADALLKILGQRRDMTGAYIDTLKVFMHNAISKEITYLGSNDGRAIPTQESA